MPSSACGVGSEPGSLLITLGSARKGASVGRLGELRGELTEAQVLALLADQAEGRDVPERRGAAVAQHHLVAVGQAEQLAEARRARGRRGCAPAPGGGRCPSARCRWRRGRRGRRPGSWTVRLRIVRRRAGGRRGSRCRSRCLLCQPWWGCPDGGSSDSRSRTPTRRCSSRRCRGSTSPATAVATRRRSTRRTSRSPAAPSSSATSTAVRWPRAPGAVARTCWSTAPR